VIHAQPDQTPRERRHDANLGRILDAAFELIAAGGLEGLSMARLADAVDYTPGALYRYVDSKDALLAQVVQRILADARVALDAAVAGLPPRASPLARVVALARAYRELARREPHRIGLLAIAMAEPRILLADAAHAQLVAASVIAALQPLADALGAAAAAGLLSPGDAVERTLCLFAMLHGLLQLPKLSRAAPRPLDVDRLAVAGTRALLIGWGGGPRTVDATLART
jgi:AcrR family transcriptional regulator